jgi:HD-GYP domain-containing protein (c-di-GMP phosphodiesterase class II)
MSQEHVPIRVSTLRGDQKIDFDAYLKINEKFILYLRRGDSFEGDRLSRLKSKKLKKMFIIPTDEENYRTYLHRNIEMAYDKGSGKSVETRAEIIQGSQQSNSEAVMENPENEQVYGEAKSGALKFAQWLTGEDEAFKHIMNIENSDQSIAHHGVTVSTLSVALAKRLGWNDEKQIQMLTLGSLLHDFEHFHSGLSIARPLEQFTPDELKIYKDHPVAGGKRVQDKKHFDQQVLNIIVQHEEYIDGKGYPQGLNEQKMDPLAVVCATANALDRMITFEGVPKAEAAKKLMISAVGRYPLKYIQLLGEIMNQMKA